MRSRMLALVALGLTWGATTLRAQRAPTTRAEDDPIGTRTASSAVTVSAGKLPVLLPLLTAEAGGTGTPLDRLAQVGMNKQEYTALRRSLMIARLDAQQPTRLQSLTGSPLQLRQANVSVYNANKARLDAVLTKLEPEPGCALCTPGSTVGKKGEDTLSTQMRR